jgi:hypothetical protein
MSTLTPGPVRPQRPAAESDVYTAIIGIAALFLLAATIYVAVRAYMAFGSLLPPGGS